VKRQIIKTRRARPYVIARIILGIVLITPHSRVLHGWADSGWPIMHAWVAVECFLSRGKQRFGIVLIAAVVLVAYEIAVRAGLHFH